MSVQKTNSYSYPADSKLPDFSLETISLDEACVLNDDIVQSLYNIIWIKEGTATYTIDFKEFEVTGNTIFFLNPGQIFSIKNEKVKTGCRIAFSQDFHCVETHNSEIACNGLLFNNVYQVPYINLSQGQSQELQVIIEKLIGEFQSPGLAHKEMLSTYLKLMLIATTRVKNEMIDRQEEKSNGFSLESRFSELVERQFRKEHSVTSYADQLGVAPKSLSKRFAELKIEKPSQIIKNRLLLEAKRLLRYTDKSIKEICFELGFDDPGYFSRFFKKSTQLSPLEYKQSRNGS